MIKKVRHHTEQQGQFFSTRRIEALTDGVFAIAMTLLVLDLKTADLGKVSSSRELLSVIIQHEAALTSFIISFLLLGSMWAVHTRQFEYIKKTDRHLTMINTIRLLVVVIIPLTTSMASNYQSFVLGRVLLPINFLLLAVVSYWQWSYAVSPKNHFDENLSSTVKKQSHARNVSVMITSLLVVIGSIFIGELAFLLFLFAPRVVDFLYKKTGSLQI